VSAPIAVQGLWWLPDQPDHKVGGWLTFDDQSGGRLILGGTLRPTVWDDHRRHDGTVQRVPRAHDEDANRTYPIVHGQHAQTAYSLVNCFQARVAGYRSPTATEEVTVNTVLTSAWFEDEADLQFTRARIDLRQLTTFVGRNGLKSEFPFAEAAQDVRYSIVTSTRLPPIDLQVNEPNAFFVHILEQTGDQFHNVIVSQRWGLDIRTDEPRPIQDFLDLMSDVQDLISVASGSRSCVDGFEFEHPDVLERALNGAPVGNVRKPIPYVTRWSQRAVNDNLVSKHDFYFDFDDLGGTDGIGRWLATAREFRTELGRAMATRYSSTMFLEDRISNLCAALESLDAVQRGVSENFADHVKSCVARAGATFTNMLTIDSDLWAMQVKEIRHDLAHHRQRFRANETGINHLVAEQLFWLFAIGLLRTAEAPPAVFGSIGRHAQIQWLTEQAANEQGPQAP
jgi:hypothetical protein